MCVCVYVTLSRTQDLIRLSDKMAAVTCRTISQREIRVVVAKALSSSSHDHMDGSCKSRPSIDRWSDFIPPLVL